MRNVDRSMPAPWRLAALALLALAACGEGGLAQKARAGEARLGDPAGVVAATCKEAASSLCRCIVAETVKTMQAGPREIYTLFERPQAVWDDVLQGLSREARDKAANIRAAAETNCARRGRLAPAKSMEIAHVRRRSGASGPAAQAIRVSCTSEGNSIRVCVCYEETLRNALSEEAYEGLRVDARFPPPLAEMAPKPRRMALATIASARSVCGLR